MPRQILFHAHCSKTKRPFLVEGMLDGNVLRWTDAFEMIEGTYDEKPVSELPDLVHRAEGFKCPCCGYLPRMGNFSFWSCSSCGEIHCGGKSGNVHHGACGTCLISPEQLSPIEKAKVSLADKGKF